MYKQCKNPTTNQLANCVIRTTDNACIPFDPDNTDAVEFAKWMQDGNRPEPAEEGGTVTDEWVAETIVRLLPNPQE